MAVGKFYSLPEIDLRKATDKVFGSCIRARRSTDKASWLGSQFVDLARSRPEDLPPCFLAVQADALSLRTGWTTEHGRWVPKSSFARILNGMSLFESFSGVDHVNKLVKTTLVFLPNDGSKSDLQMTLYNEISWKEDKGYFVEEDMTLCLVSRRKRKGVVHSEASPHSFWPQYGIAADLYYEEIYESHSVQDFLDFDAPDFTNFEAQDTSVGGWDLPSIDSPGGPKKRPRPKPVGGSEVWRDFTKIYTKDPKVEYAACNHCGRMFLLKGGSTSSLLKHSKTCQCKPDSSVDTLID